MVCTNTRSLVRYLLLGLCVLSLCSCGGLSKKERKPKEEVPVQVEGQPIVLIPNPYLSQEVSIAAEAKSLFEQAKVAMQSEDWPTAKSKLTQLTELHPTLSGGFVNLGIVNEQMGDTDAAEQAYRYAIEQNALNGDAYVRYGILLREQGRFDESAAQYNKALEVWPHNLQAHINLGILYDLYMGKWPEALEHYQMALNIKGDDDMQLKGWLIDLQRRMPEPAEAE